MSNNLTYIPYYQPLSSPSVSFQQQQQLSGNTSFGFPKYTNTVGQRQQFNQTLLSNSMNVPNIPTTTITNNTTTTINGIQSSSIPTNTGLASTAQYNNSNTGLSYSNISSIPNNSSFNQKIGTILSQPAMNFLKSPLIISSNSGLSNSTMPGDFHLEQNQQQNINSQNQNQMYQSRGQRSPTKQGTGLGSVPILRSSSSKRANEITVEKQYEIRNLFPKQQLQTQLIFDKNTILSQSFQFQPSSASFQASNNSITQFGQLNNTSTINDNHGIEVNNKNGVFEVKCDSIVKQSEEVLNILSKELNMKNIKQTMNSIKELEVKYHYLQTLLQTKYSNYILGQNLSINTNNEKTNEISEFDKKPSTGVVNDNKNNNMPIITITPLDSDNKILKISKIPENLTIENFQIESNNSQQNMPHTTTNASNQSIASQKKIAIISEENKDITIVLNEIKGNTNIQTYGNSEKIFKTETDDDPTEQYTKEQIKQRFLAINDEDNPPHLLSIPGEIKKKPSNSPKKMSFDVAEVKGEYKSSDEIERILQEFKNNNNSGMSKSVNHEANQEQQQDKNNNDDESKKKSNNDILENQKTETEMVKQSSQNSNNPKRKLSDIQETSKDNTASKADRISQNNVNDKSPGSSKNSKKNNTQELMDRVNNVLQRSDQFLMKHSDKKLKKGASKNFTNLTADEVQIEKGQQEYDQSSEIKAIMNQVKRKQDNNNNQDQEQSDANKNINLKLFSNSPTSNRQTPQNKSQTDYIPSANLSDNLRKSTDVKSPSSNIAVHGSENNTGTHKIQSLMPNIDSPSSVHSYQPISHDQQGYQIKSTFSKLAQQATSNNYGSFACPSPKTNFNIDSFNQYPKGSSSVSSSPKEFKSNNVLQNKQIDEIIGDSKQDVKKSINSLTYQSPQHQPLSYNTSVLASPNNNINNLKDSLSSKPLSDKIDSLVNSQKNSGVIKFQHSDSHYSDLSQLDKVNAASPKNFITNTNILSQITPQTEQSSKQQYNLSNQTSEARKDLNSMARNIGQSGVFSPQSISSNKSAAVNLLTNQGETSHNIHNNNMENSEQPTINPFLKECASQEGEEQQNPKPNELVSLKQLRCSQSMYAPLYNPVDPFSYSISNFEVGKKLGHGKFADVYAAVDKQTGFRVALKQIKKETIKEYNLYQDILNEIKVQGILNHPNIIKLYGFFIDHDSIYLIQELACGKELFSELKSTPYKKFTESVASFYVRQVIEALIYMHSKNVVHRDLKPENIMVFNGLLKICDFGYAARVEKNKMRNTFCGTLDYVSPEMVQGKSYDFSVDIWSVGILTYELLIGYAPFAGKNHDATFDQIVNGELRFSNPVSFEGGDFISRILERDPGSRMNLSQALQHPFIQNEYIKRLQNDKSGEIDFSDFNKL